MSEPENTPDPVDRAYAQAEALLNDEAARAARRARVLAAVAAEPPQQATAPRRAWSHGGLLVAAGVAGVSVLLATQIRAPVAVQPPPAPIVATAPSVQMPTAAPSTSPQAPVARAAAARGERPKASARLAAPLAEDAAAPPPPALDAQPPSPGLEEARSPSAPPPPPPPPPPPAPAAAAPALKGSLEEIVVTGSRIEAPRAAARAKTRGVIAKASPAALAAQLREAAAQGQTADVAALLDQGAPVDAADADGETALMKSLAARRPEVAALLRRRGASLDRKNQAGVSAREMAKAIGDPALKRALGLDD